jgi:hypothetical protein
VAAAGAGVVALALVAVALLAGGGGDESRGLRVERDPTRAGLLIRVDPADNEPARARGARSVTIDCYDAEGRSLIRAPAEWPLPGTDTIARGPHAHLALDPEGLGRVAGCRLERTSPPLEGELAR